MESQILEDTVRGRNIAWEGRPLSNTKLNRFPNGDFHFSLDFDPSMLVHEFRRARQAIFRRHDVCEDVCIMGDGWAYRHLQLADGRRQILSILLPGDVMTAAAPFQSRLDYSVQTLTDVNFYRIGRDQLRLRIDQPRFLHEMAKILVAERSDANDQMMDLGQRQADERIAGLIVRLRDRLHARGQVVEESFNFPLRQQHIADSTGLTSVHVSRVLTRFRKDGLMEIAGGRIRLYNVAELRRLGELH